MIKAYCDWCGTEIEHDDEAFEVRARSPLFEAVSGTTQSTTVIELMVTTNGVTNNGHYHTLCLLRILVHKEAELKAAQINRDQAAIIQGRMSE